MLLGLLAAAAGGLVAGSLVEFVAGRLAAGGSPAAPPPHCPRCEHRLAARDLIPVLSWLRLHGRCGHCHEPIARRHLVVEGLTALLFADVVLGTTATARRSCSASRSPRSSWPRR